MTDPTYLHEDSAAKLEEIQRKAELVRDGLNNLAVTDRSDDGLVTVTVNASGNLTDLRLGNLRDPDGPELAHTIMRTVQRAQSRLVDAVQTTMPPAIGEEMMGELVRQYRGSYPEPEPEPTRGGRRTLRLGATDEDAADSVRSSATRRRPASEPPDDLEFSDRKFLR